MTTAALGLFFSISTAVFAVNVNGLTQAVVRAHPTDSPTRFVGLTAKRTNPTTVGVTWNFGERDFHNATVQFRPSDGGEWENSVGSTPETISSVHFHYVALSRPCSAYDIRLRSSVGSGADGRFYYTETVTSAPEIPNQLEPIRPIVSRNYYNKQTNTVDLIISIENHTLASWPLSSRDLKVHIQVIDHRPGLSEVDHTMYPEPSAQWTTSAEGYFRFAEPYISSVRSGGVFDALLYVEGSTTVCGHSVKMGEKLIDDAAFVKISCTSTAGMDCPPEATKKKIPSPRCNPQSVDALQIPIADANPETELRIQWDFSKSSAPDETAPKRIRLHYGYTDLAPDADPLSVLAPMHEIDRFEVDGSFKNATFRTKKMPAEIGHDQGQRFYRVSICAVYGDDEADNEISWGIVATFPVKTSQPLSPKEKQCRCEEPSSNSIRDKVASADTTVPSTRAPPIVSSPSNPYENYWVKVAPLLVVFTVMTVLNLILFLASYYYYKKARRMNALK